LKDGPHHRVKDLLDHYSSDDRADLFKLMNSETYKSMISILSTEDRNDVQKLIAYDEGLAGSVMSTDFASGYIDQTVSSLIEKIKKEGPSKETIYYIYILDGPGYLKGLVSLKDLILAAGDKKVTEIMLSDIVTANIMDDQEDVARKIKEYDILALPIVSDDHHLLGIVTHDDVMDILQEEQTEDVERLMAISGEVEERSYLDVPVFKHFKKRVPWVIALFALGNLSASVVGHFEGILNEVVILAFFFPLLMGTGGNTGGQAASVVLRALTLQDLTEADFFKVIFKEMRIALLLGGILFCLIYLRVHFFYNDVDQIWKTALAIALALGAQVLTSTLIGALLPLMAAKAKLDPAVVAMPAITTIVDITGLIIYFKIAGAILAI